MSMAASIDPIELTELHWQESGQASFSGSLLRLFRRLDAMFCDWATTLNSQEFMFPPFLSSKQMNKLDYFKSFPHLITIPVTLESSAENLQAFADSPLDENYNLKLPQLAAAKQVLTPAACYHFYDELEGAQLNSGLYLTTRCVCYRNELAYQPLRRQWAFSMREIVCISSIDEVQSFLQVFEQKLAEYFALNKFPVKFEYATDPFFNPRSNPKYLLQKLEPVKKEMIYDGQLSIGSLNFHRNFFGETFQISHNKEAAYTACVAFGIERWMYMILNERGLQENGWSF